MICQRNHETMSTADQKKTMVSKILMIRLEMLVGRLKKITRLTLNAYICFAHKCIKTADGTHGTVQSRKNMANIFRVFLTSFGTYFPRL